MSESHIKFDQVTKTYDGKQFVVKGFNLEVGRGEFVTMLGPSGSGKTTCLMMLAGFEEISSGEIYMDGEKINTLAPHKRNIGMVFQNYALFPHMTVAQNLAYPLKFRQFDKQQIDQQVKKYLDLVALGDFAQRYPNQLSGGQKQRVALARCLIFEPSLVLMDEPLGALDKNLREQMQYEIKRLHKLLNFTVMYVTHDQTEALTMSDRIVVFDEGIVQQVSSAKTLYEAPKNKFVADFIGENNKLLGQLQDIDLGIATVSVGQASIRALSIDLDIDTNKDVYLSIRPEKILIGTKESNINGYNNFDGMIDDIVYIGDHLRIYVRFLEVQQFVVKVPNDEFHAKFSNKQSVVIAWQPEDCRALNDK
ncbi:Putrescine transport ATP-binding protein PotA (TC 3.A.1.11.1) [uncultured Candidatus Thioglobus sp.]|nr:Putrescine transport ATP-binding protein PotA (TC 3.A.1.11.1) [uncultured Candidatus Thioglobus sp.]